MKKRMGYYGVLAAFAVAFSGCGDDSSGGSKKDPDASPSMDSHMADGQMDSSTPRDAGIDAAGDTGGTSDSGGCSAPCDVGVDGGDARPPVMDAMPDAAPPVPDADPIIMPGMECMNDEMCGDYERCVGELCKIDLRPEVFAIDTVMVSEPAASAGLLQGVLQGIIQSHQLNLLVEPGGYQENGDYRWYIGNGGFREGTFVYLGQYPIQNFDGFWRTRGDGTRYWSMQGDTPFVLNVPAGQVQTAEGVVTCMTAFNIIVQVTLTPETDGAGNPRMAMTLDGFLRDADARTVNFQFNGVEVSLTSFLDPMDLTIDTDADGIPDAYPFAFTGMAGAVNFVGDPPAADGSNRDPNAVIDNPPECDE